MEDIFVEESTLYETQDADVCKFSEYIYNYITSSDQFPPYLWAEYWHAIWVKRASVCKNELNSIEKAEEENYG